MALDIQTIQDNGLRKAAEKADTQGEKSYNGNLDPEEISAFIKNGSESGYSMTDILEVATKVVPEDSPIIKQAIKENNEQTAKNNTKEAKKNEIAKLEEQIKSLEKELENKKDKKEDMWPNKKMTISSKGKIVVGLFGSAVGGFAGGNALLKFSEKFKSKSLRVGVGKLGQYMRIVSLPAFIALFLAAATMNDSDKIKKVYNEPENYKDSVQYNKAEQFRQEQIVPLEQQISNLKEELNAKKAELEQM